MLDLLDGDPHHTRSMYREKVIKYFRIVRAAMNAESGSVFVLDLLGGHAAESVAKLKRQNRVTGKLGLSLVMQ